MGLLDAAASGDRLRTLEAMRDSIAAEIEAFDGSRAGGTTSALHGQMLKVLEEIAALSPTEKKGTPLDELAKRRSGTAAPARSSRAARGG